MKRLFLFLIGIFLGMLLAISLAHSKDFTPIERARNLVLSEGKDQVEAGVPIKVYRKARITGGGFWHFLTVKVWQKSTVVILYQPEKESVLIVRSDIDPVSHEMTYSFYILNEHSHGTWMFFYISEKATNELVGMILKTVDNALETTLGFSPTGEMREDLCWEVKEK